MKIRGIGIDAAFSNMGFAPVSIDLGRLPGLEAITCEALSLTKTVKEAGKVVRVSSDRLRRGQELLEALHAACQGAQVAFVEIPSGTQSASAAFGLGISVGVLASCPIPIIEVSPMEVKAAVAGRKVTKGASKAEVIEWAAAHWPSAPWMRAAHKARGKGGVTLPAGRLLDDNEHMADALASVAAGIQTPAFKQLLAILRHTQNAIPMPSDERSASSRRRVSLI